ncbi:helix-turn-helix transcriptional regulator [uncultured Sphingomonas sp.]|uniref:helix-turn-helix domain-containing protein n=1 Tax=uncultured Sphingomonas sp. TaxID=158754 RepID=UPI0025F6A20B|nr:helix-turn-helix transcriptional regulator [uncultured Sphingomonas sp.]
MKALDLTQGRLASAIGVTQGAIAKVANNNPNGSSFLHLLARELRTTTDYLTGEVDDPEFGAPPPSGVRLSEEQQELLTCYDRASLPERYALLTVASAFAGRVAKRRPPPAAMIDPLAALPEGEAEGMFKQLLLGIDRNASLDEQAQLLAERLPIALSQLRAFRPDAPPPLGSPVDPRPAAVAASSTHDRESQS